MEAVGPEGGPGGCAGAAEDEERRNDRRRVEALAPLLRPVNILEVQPEGELVEDERRPDTVEECEEDQPLTVAPREGEREVADGEQDDAVDEVMDVRAPFVCVSCRKGSQ